MKVYTLFAPYGCLNGYSSFDAVLCCCGFSSGKLLLLTSRFVWIMNEGCEWQQKNAKLRLLRYNNTCQAPITLHQKR